MVGGIVKGNSVGCRKLDNAFALGGVGPRLRQLEGGKRPEPLRGRFRIVGHQNVAHFVEPKRRHEKPDASCKERFADGQGLCGVGLPPLEL